MIKHQDKKRKQDLGIFYTPAEVVDFIFDILNVWKNTEDKEIRRWQSREPKAHYPSVIDPACGEGIFLKEAVSSGFTIPRYIWGVDIDSQVKERWVEINLLKSFGSKADLNFHFIHQNGLIPIPEKVIGHKKEGMNQYDAVVGNPPYGGVGLGKEQITFELIQQMTAYSVLPQNVRRNLPEEDIQPTLLEKPDDQNNLAKINNRLRSFPIEILFLERFIQLAKPGGWIAIVIPDGILTNSNTDYVREYVSKKTKVEAIISLPRNTFKNAGTSAKTSILFLRKLKKDEKPNDFYPVFLASAEKIDKSIFETIVKSYEKFYNVGENHMNKSDLIQITKDQNKREAVMVRVDKTLKELMEEKPASRWDPNFWHPIYEKNLTNIKYPTGNLGMYIIFATYGQVGRREFVKTGIPYLSAKTFTFTGIDRSLRPVFIKENSYNDPSRSRVKKNDWLLVGVGVGSVGKSVVVDIDDYKIFGQFGQDVKLVRFKEKTINPYYVDIYIKAIFGSKEVARYTSGVSGVVNIDFDEIKAIKIPLVPDKIQQHIELQYKKMTDFHNRAMGAKKKDDVSGYKTNLETAEKMLKDLIGKTEAVIRGEREDVV